MFESPFLATLRALKPDHIICEDKGKILRASILETRSISLANYLKNQGLKKGDIVLFACESGIEFLVLFIALVHLRVRIALVDPHMGRKLYEAKVKQLKPQWAFIDSRLLLLQEHPIIRFIYRRLKPDGFYIPFSREYKIFSTGKWLPILQQHSRLKYQKTAQDIFEISDENDELVFVYTSGTLAEPKAVVHTVKSLSESLNAVASLFINTTVKSIVTHLPHFALIGMVTGFKTYFWKEALSPEQRIKFIEKKGISTYFGPPTEYFALMDFCRQHSRKFPDCLRHLILGSAPILKSFLKELRKYTSAKITCLYGMTENLVVASIDGDEKLNSNEEGDVLGYPYSSIDYLISEDGELNLKSPMLFKKYFLKEKVVGQHPTGDLIYQDALGRLVLKGRKKNMIIRGNKNIYPALYEGSICNIKGVKEAFMLGIYNETKHDEEVFLLVNADKKVTEDFLFKELKSGKFAIDSDAIPDYILLIEIPKSGRQQKPDKAKMIEIIKSKLSKNTTS